LSLAAAAAAACASTPHLVSPPPPATAEGTPAPAPQPSPCDSGNALELPATPTISDAVRQQMEANELVQLVPQLDATEDKKLLPMFLKALSDQAESPEQLAFIGELAAENAGLFGGVKVAKHALRKNVVLTQVGWPHISLPDAIGTEPALALAIIRQESEFDDRARSSADARGLMQLLPGTAKEMAKKLDISYHKDDLWNGKRNITLGTSYLGRMVNGFDGSYILAIAAYNAGPGNVRKWLALQGWPPKDEAGAVNWVESIPYAETRNYVQRVLENLQIYRQLYEPNHPLQITRDLVR
jgi:soluble lytic murein transglycosylase